MKDNRSHSTVNDGINYQAVPQSGSYGTPKGTPDVKMAGKVADLKSKTGDPSSGKPEMLGAITDYKPDCN
jgi:hypothetical protein